LAKRFISSTTFTRFSCSAVIRTIFLSLKERNRQAPFGFLWELLENLITNFSSRQPLRAMGSQPKIVRLQEKLDRITKKWWLYLLLLLVFFFPTYAQRSYDPRQSTELIGQVLSAPLITTYSVLNPIAKIIPVVLIGGLFLYGNKVRRAFNIYVAVLYLALSLFQSSAVTKSHGLVILTGNLVLVLVVALVWMWEVVAERNSFAPRKRPLWKWWVAPLVVLPFLAPVNPSTLSPDFSLAGLLTNEAGLIYCMMSPVFLAVLILFHPTVNLAVLRVSGFAGMLFGVVNMIMWFVLEPWGWWMGVLHIPLVVLSVYAFVISLVGPERESPSDASI
jgi:hypothetical protein